MVMWRRGRSNKARGADAVNPAKPNALRDRSAVLLALVTVLSLAAVFLFARDTRFLMPGPLVGAHSAIENCSTCHTKSGSNNLSWLHGLVAGDRRADSNACLTCHKMPETAFNAHGVSASILKQSTERLTKIAATTPAPLSARAQATITSKHGMAEGGLQCATCHQEHQGAKFNLSKISNEQCRSCHVVKFDSFDGDHPEFENYPFRRRTRIIYDHVGHFTKHFPEAAKKDPKKRAPETCSACHSSGADKRVMGVAPFEQTCIGCHLDQITGKERVSGPKGIAFISLPGLDLPTLKKKNASVGEWPEASEAELTPFMKVMISRTARGRSLLKIVERLDLQDLSAANDEQIKAVVNLSWEIKRLIHALVLGRASDVFADVGGDAKLSASVVADLTAKIPRDVVVSAYQHWLPNLGTEMANRRDTRERRQGSWITTVTESKLPDDNVASAAQADQNTPTKGTSDAATAKAAPAESARPSGKEDAGDGKAPSKETQAASARPPGKAGEQTDDLLYPTEEELRAMAAPVREALKAGQPKGSAAKSGAVEGVPDRGGSTDAAAPAAPSADADASSAQPRTRSAPAMGIESKIDAESWAEYGGWYRQDYAIFYRPTGHKDKFIQSWLAMTGPHAIKGAKSPASAVFDALTSKDAQGSCTKCHSVDDTAGKGRAVNFSPVSVESKQGNFTQFIHEPHFGMMEPKGCLTCHVAEKDRAYLKSYEHGNPQSFTSNFSPVKKDLCETCHTGSKARQDCLTCHKYHVNGVTTPITSTKVPSE